MERRLERAPKNTVVINHEPKTRAEKGVAKELLLPTLQKFGLNGRRRKVKMIDFILETIALNAFPTAAARYLERNPEEKSESTPKSLPVIPAMPDYDVQRYGYFTQIPPMANPSSSQAPVVGSSFDMTRMAEVCRGMIKKMAQIQKRWLGNETKKPSQVRGGGYDRKYSEKKNIEPVEGYQMVPIELEPVRSDWGTHSIFQRYRQSASLVKGPAETTSKDKASRLLPKPSSTSSRAPSSVSTSERRKRSKTPPKRPSTAPSSKHNDKKEKRDDKSLTARDRVSTRKESSSSSRSKDESTSRRKRSRTPEKARRTSNVSSRHQTKSSRKESPPLSKNKETEKKDISSSQKRSCPSQANTKDKKRRMMDELFETKPVDPVSLPATNTDTHVKNLPIPLETPKGRNARTSTSHLPMVPVEPDLELNFSLVDITTIISETPELLEEIRDPLGSCNQDPLENPQKLGEDDSLKAPVSKKPAAKKVSPDETRSLPHTCHQYPQLGGGYP